MLNTVLSPPVPPYSNPPIQPQFYQPGRFVISNITLGQTTIVTVLPASFNTVSTPLNYVVGQLVRLLIPNGYGCTQLNNIPSYVLSIPGANQVELKLDSSFSNNFIAASLNQMPQIIALGDVNSGSINTMGPFNTGTFIPGSFLDISPI